MVDRILDAESAAIFRESIMQLQVDVHDYLHPDTHTAWTKMRPTTTGAKWDDATADELWVAVSGGTGKLYPNGPGGLTATEDVIFPEAPYRYRTLADAGFVDGVTYLIINGSRLFRVEAWKPSSIDKVLADAFLRELFDTDLPEVTP